MGGLIILEMGVGFEDGFCEVRRLGLGFVYGTTHNVYYVKLCIGLWVVIVIMGLLCRLDTLSTRTHQAFKLIEFSVGPGEARETDASFHLAPRSVSFPSSARSFRHRVCCQSFLTHPGINACRPARCTTQQSRRPSAHHFPQHIHRHAAHSSISSIS